MHRQAAGHTPLLYKFTIFAPPPPHPLDGYDANWQRKRERVMATRPGGPARPAEWAPYAAGILSIRPDCHGLYTGTVYSIQ